ncbi:hypothetical protein A3Q37_03729 [Streptomyces sp. PTY087I2]|nr:hypothetical protein A3Q37_03729 [Streptomyces sp. PTY087I2]
MKDKDEHGRENGLTCPKHKAAAGKMQCLN